MVKDNVGVKIYVDVESDISTQTVLEINYKKPSGASGTWTATLGTTQVIVKGTTLEANTYIYYVTQAGDIDEAGDWNVQSYVELSGGYKGGGTDNNYEAWSIMHVGDHL